MMAVIFVCCSAESLAEPAAAPWPVVVFCSVVDWLDIDDAAPLAVLSLLLDLMSALPLASGELFVAAPLSRVLSISPLSMEPLSVARVLSASDAFGA